MYLCLIWQMLTAFSYGRILICKISSGIFQGKRKQFACNLKCRYCVFTQWGSIGKWFLEGVVRYPLPWAQTEGFVAWSLHPMRLHGSKKLLFYDIIIMRYFVCFVCFFIYLFSSVSWSIRVQKADSFLQLSFPVLDLVIVFAESSRQHSQGSSQQIQHRLEASCVEQLYLCEDRTKINSYLQFKKGKINITVQWKQKWDVPNMQYLKFPNFPTRKFPNFPTMHCNLVQLNLACRVLKMHAKINCF